MKKLISNRKRKKIPGHIDHFIACDRVAEKYGLDADKLQRSIKALFSYSVRMHLSYFYPVFIKNFGKFTVKRQTATEIQKAIRRGRKVANQENCKSLNKKKKSVVKNNKKKRTLAETNKTTQR